MATIAADQYVNITGIPPRTPDGDKVQIRHECSAWAKDLNSIQVSLFIRAMQKFYEVSYEDTLSYFQVASIHGYPGNLEWDNGGPPRNMNPADNPDPHFIYCTHGTELFPVWHRPYMLLFEQCVWKHMLNVIDEHLTFHDDEEREQWIDEAYRWRLPYWDWGQVAKFDIPAIFTTATIEVRQPKAADGSAQKSEPLVNPLYRYQMIGKDGKPLAMGKLEPSKYQIPDDIYNDKEFFPWSQCAGTSRWGIKTPWIPPAKAPTLNAKEIEGINEFSGSNEAIKKHAYYKDLESLQKQSVSDLVIRLLTPGAVKTWNAFATTKYVNNTSTDWKDYVNLEFLHNNLHNFIGGLSAKTGLGHMSDVPVAAFDPVFWMHHVNVDRQCAIWQHLNPDQFLPPTSDPPNDNAELNARSNLRPFRHMVDGQWTFWTPEACRYIEPLGYTYPELVWKLDESQEQHATRIIAKLYDKFESTSDVLLGTSSDKASTLGVQSIEDGTTFPDYVISVLYDRFALKGAAYTIHFFLDDISDDDINNSEYGAEYLESHVGSVYNFSSPYNFSEERCANCAVEMKEEALSCALVPLTIPLYDLAINPDFEPVPNITDDLIKPFLKQALHWRATDISGHVIPAKSLPRTRVMVLSGHAKHYAAKEKPTEYLEYKPMHEVTEKKKWGASSDDYAKLVDGTY